jgi:D-alanine-D-alanine ligase
MSKDVINRYKVGVLAGGSSNEREISLKSGAAVLGALERRGINAVFLDVNENDLENVIRRSGIDLAFIALHGRFGEDGIAQSLLGKMRIPYTGSGPEASHLALDKLASKEIFRSKGLLVPPWKVIRSTGDISSGIEWMPCVVKPRSEGSSIGLSVVRRSGCLEHAVIKALEYDEDVIIEKFVEGREITVSILDGRALPVIEIIAQDGTYDFDAKYKSNATRYAVLSDSSGAEIPAARETALKAHKALGCRGFSRVDMRLADKGACYVLEVNTIPGLTERSLLPMAAKAEGLDLGELCVKMLKAAVSDPI